MKSRHWPKIKTLLIGLLIVKISLTLFYLSGTFSVFEIFLPHQAAIAQEVTPDGKEEAGKTNSTGPEKKKDPPIDLQMLLNTLEEKRLQIRREEARLEQKQMQIEALKQEVEEKIAELSKIRQQVEAGLAKKEEKITEAQRLQNEAEDAKIKQLVKVYTTMKPKTAAALIDKMDIEVIMKLFSNMKGEQIGNILSFVNQDRAADISERLAAQNRRPEK